MQSSDNEAYESALFRLGWFLMGAAYRLHLRFLYRWGANLCNRDLPASGDS